MYVLQEAKSNQMLHKSHKTPWGKVKDIIQTRTGSIKKKRNDGDQDDDGQPEVIEIHSEEMRQDVEVRIYNLTLKLLFWFK